MSQTKRKSKWSLIKYDLKTGLDVLKLPCVVKLADSTSETTAENPADEISRGCAIKFEKKLCICFVRARVLELSYVDWFVKKKGDEFVRSYSLMADSEILIPIEYDGKVKLFERSGGKKYFSIREVIEDFPRFVRVDKDTICASPGIQTAQIVEKGTILELDRVTKSVQVIRGSRETYLICKDNENSRELAFRAMTPVHFTKVADMSKHCLKDFVEHLPLPQTVEFTNVNPYDVISLDDDDARDILVMLSGPIELLGVHMEQFIVGKVDKGDSNACDIIAIPDKDSVLESFYVHLPTAAFQNNSRKTDSLAGEYVDLAALDDGIYACLRRKLYLRYASDEAPLVVRADDTENLCYEVEETPDTPPIPEKLDECLLKHTASLSDCSTEQENIKEHFFLRKRFFSANDIGRNDIRQRTDTGQRGLKPFLSQLSRKVKSTASQIFFGLEAFSGADQDLEHGGKISSASRNESISSDFKNNRTGFVCYLDCDLKIEPSSENVLSFYGTNNSDSVIKEEVVYASVDIMKKNASAIQVSHFCPVCRESNKSSKRISDEKCSIACENI